MGGCGAPAVFLALSGVWCGRHTCVLQCVRRGPCRVWSSVWFTLLFCVCGGGLLGSSVVGVAPHVFAVLVDFSLVCSPRVCPSALTLVLCWLAGGSVGCFLVRLCLWFSFAAPASLWVWLLLPVRLPCFFVLVLVVRSVVLLRVGLRPDVMVVLSLPVSLSSVGGCFIRVVACGGLPACVPVGVSMCVASDLGSVVVVRCGLLLRGRGLIAISLWWCCWVGHCSFRLVGVSYVGGAACARGVTGRCGAVVVA